MHMRPPPPAGNGILLVFARSVEAVRKADVPDAWVRVVLVNQPNVKASSSSSSSSSSASPHSQGVSDSGGGDAGAHNSTDKRSRCVPSSNMHSHAPSCREILKSSMTFVVRLCVCVFLVRLCLFECVQLIVFLLLVLHLLCGCITVACACSIACVRACNTPRTNTLQF
jgi:hypothetical protein